METADAGAAVAPAPPAQVIEAPRLVEPPLVREVVPVGRDELHANVTWASATVGTLLTAFLVLRFLPSIGWPLVLAMIMAYLCDPLVHWASRRRISRGFSTGLIVLLGAFATAMVVALGVPKIIDQVENVPRYMTWAVANVLDRLDRMAPEVLQGTSIPRDLAHLRGYLQEHLHDIVAQVLPEAKDVLTTVVGGSLSALTFVLGALVIPVVGFFLLRGWPDILHGADELVPSRQRPFVRARMKEIDRVLSGFVRGQLTMAAVLSVLYSTAMTVIGLKLAWVVGLVTGFGNLVPYVGTSTGILLSVGFCLVDFGADYHLWLVLGTFATLMACDSLFITPRVVGPRVGLSPAAVIVAVLTCGTLFGFGGVLLAVPSAAVLKVVVRTLTDTWRRSRTYREG